MDYSIENFEKKHNKIICIDSDGTMIDAMNVKHDKCHGESFIHIWNLEDHAKEIHEIWDSINLYEKTRGINRFIAIKEMFKRINHKYVEIDDNDLEIYSKWVEKNNLAHSALVDEINNNPNPLLEKIRDWSSELLERISALTPKDKPPFDKGEDALKYALNKADIAIISSSNMKAILEEWGAYDLLKYVNVITSQEVGTKGQCLSKLLEKGYDKKDILMIGDAYPDVDAANENGVYYYPILTRHEAESWQDFIDKYFDEFLNDNYDKCQEELLERFAKNFENE